MSSSKTRVTVAIEDRQGELEIVDRDFRIVQRGFGILRGELEPGIYRARARAGDAHREELFAIEPGAASLDVTMKPLRFASPLPLQGTSTSHEYHQDALTVAIGSAPVDVGLGHGTSLLLSLRDPSDACFRQRQSSAVVRDNYRRSFTGFRLRNTRGELLLDFDQTAKIETALGFAVLNLNLRPDNYLLSYERDTGEHLAMPVPCLSAWQTQVFINVEVPTELDRPGGPNMADRAVMMAPTGMPFHPNDQFFRLAEIARYALRQGRPILSREQVEAMLQEKFFNPVLGLLAAHVLLLKRQPPHELLQIVADNLAGVIGPEFPDVLALRIALAELDGAVPALPAQGLPFPPLLHASWEIVARHPQLLAPASFVRAVALRLVPQGPWLAWKPDDTAQPDSVMTVMQRLGGHHLPGKALRILGDSVRRIAFDADRPGEAPSAVQPAGDMHPPVGDNATSTLAILLALAREFPWSAWFKRLKEEASERGLLEQFTSLQRSLLPTLQLIATQLDEGDDFTLDDLQQLRERLGVPLPILTESLQDMVQKALALGVALLIDRSDANNGSSGDAPH